MYSCARRRRSRLSNRKRCLVSETPINPSKTYAFSIYTSPTAVIGRPGCSWSGRRGENRRCRRAVRRVRAARPCNGARRDPRRHSQTPHGICPARRPLESVSGIGRVAGALLLPSAAHAQQEFGAAPHVLAVGIAPTVEITHGVLAEDLSRGVEVLVGLLDDGGIGQFGIRGPRPHAHGSGRSSQCSSAAYRDELIDDESTVTHAAASVMSCGVRRAACL